MKRILFFALLAVLSFSSCDDDDVKLDGILSYDGENATGPLLDAGFYEAAARFTRSEVEPYDGRQLEEVTWFMGQLPAACEVRIYGEGSATEPGALLYSADVTSSLRELRWNRHRLSQPLTLDGEEIWISIAFTHAQQQQSIGCDSGPSDPNGDWLFQDSDNQWLTYSQRTPESVNWNIRGELSD